MPTSEEMLKHEKNATDFLNGISKTMRQLKNRAIKLGKDTSPEKVEALQKSVLLASKAIQTSRKELVKKLPKTEQFRIFHDSDAFVGHVLGTKLTRVSANLYSMLPVFSNNEDTAPERLNAVSLLNRAQMLSTAFAKIYSRSSERKPVDVRRLLLDVKKSFPAAQGKIFLSAKGSPAFSLGDKELLFKIFHDLVSNAVKATSLKGQERKIEIAAEPHSFQKEMRVVSVKDNGPGMHSEMMSNPFGGGTKFAVQGVSYGSGTALPLVRKIISEHEGSVAIHSKPGKGTIFAVSLPLIHKYRGA